MSLFDYTDGTTVFEAYFSSVDNLKKPGILLGHAWDGPNLYFYNLSDQLAKEGFNVIAYDVYGKGVRGAIKGDNSHLMNPLLNDRNLLKRRLLAAFDVAKNHPLIQGDNITSLGYCFGGLCALDLARANPKGLKGAISVHGLLIPNSKSKNKTIDASVLVLNGWSDPMVPAEHVLAFTKEMTEANADWQIHNYGHAMHAYTMEGANLPSLGISYNEKAAKRSHETILSFLRSIK